MNCCIDPLLHSVGAKCMRSRAEVKQSTCCLGRKQKLQRRTVHHEGQCSGDGPSSKHWEERACATDAIQPLHDGICMTYDILHSGICHTYATLQNVILDCVDVHIQSCRFAYSILQICIFKSVDLHICARSISSETYGQISMTYLYLHDGICMTYDILHSGICHTYATLQLFILNCIDVHIQFCRFALFLQTSRHIQYYTW